MRPIIVLLILSSVISLSSCKKYLDIIPDNVATLDYAFRTRNEAEKFLFTCYSFMPNSGIYATNPALTAGDETWWEYPLPSGTENTVPFLSIALGLQNIVSPMGNLWSNGNSSLYKGIRNCNLFMDNISLVPDMEFYEKEQWIAEAQFLKAYYHWLLLRMYGPIPISDKAELINIDPESAQARRENVDSCFNYIIELLDKAMVKLPPIVQDPIKELGRITLPIAASLKARILVTAASPLFNGNTDYNGFKDKTGSNLFNTQFDPTKWAKAFQACREAINICEAAGAKLYQFNPQLDVYNLNEEMKTRMGLRNRMTEKWNSEIIWGDPNSMVSTIQTFSLPAYNQITISATGYNRSESSPPLKIAKMYYTKNGVPINEDKTLDFREFKVLRKATIEERFQVAEGVETVRLHFDREPRFYADLIFDGSILYGAGNFVDTLAWPIRMKKGEWSGYQGANRRHSITGYYPKKLVSFLNTMSNTNSRTVNTYPWPLMRLADLYLLYAEASNEVNGPSPETFKYIDKVRERAGIPPLEQSWDLYSTNPGKAHSKDGLREIIKQERMIEMAFEGNRFWDIRRWKDAEKYLNQPIEGWDVNQKDESFYTVITIFNQTFKKRDYFWPIKESDMIMNKKLVQNPGW